jgi:hypothetical protein
MQISGLSGASALWAARPASEVGRSSLAELETRPVEPRRDGESVMFEHITKSDREVLFAATGSWIDASGRLNFELPKTYDEMRSISHFFDQVEIDRRIGALVGDVSSDYIKDLTVRVSDGSVNSIDPKLLDRALEFTRSREAGGTPARVPLDVRA